MGDYMTTCVRAEGMDRNKSVDAAVDVGEVEKGAGLASAHRARGVAVLCNQRLIPIDCRKAK